MSTAAVPSLHVISSTPTVPISKLPAPSVPPPAIQPASADQGAVVFYRDNNWQSQSVTVTTDSYREEALHYIGDTMQDAATWVAFNLPVGVVMTICDNFTPVKSGTPIWNLAPYGRCVDLVGTGQTEAVDLTQVNMNDCVSAFFWRKVDLRMGGIELYDDINFGGNRNVLFLSEWPQGTITSIGDWWLNDRVSSVRWASMNDRVYASLFENSDGSGRSYDNIQGWGSTKDESNLNNDVFNDCMSSFIWNGIAPKQEIIAPFTLPISGMTNAYAYKDEQTLSNPTPNDQSTSVIFTKTDMSSVTVTSTETSVVGVEVSSTVKANYGVAEASLSIKLSYNYTKTNTSTLVSQSTIGLAVTQPVVAPAGSDLTAHLLVQMGTLPPTTYQTTADRWYDQPVTGGVLDPGTGWYKRTEPVTGTVAGGLQSSASVDFTVSLRTSTSLSSSVSPSTHGQPVDLAATVSTVSQKQSPFGNVIFMDGSAALGTAALSGGKAVLKTAALALGTHTITAEYAGAVFTPGYTFAASSSPALLQVVQAAGPQQGGHGH